MHLPVPPPLVAPAVILADRVLRATVRWGCDDPHGAVDAARAGAPRIFACRHGQLWPLLWAVEDAGLSILVSRSGDGELLARVLRAKGFGLVRGSSSRDAAGAARGALRALRAGRSVGLAVDGPRGPRDQVQDGVLRLAQRAEVPIVPLRLDRPSGWIARGSWDRFEIPRPGRRVRLSMGEPVTVAQGPKGLHQAGQALALALGGWRANGTSRAPSPGWEGASGELHGNPG